MPRLPKGKKYLNLYLKEHTVTALKAYSQRYEMSVGALVDLSVGAALLNSESSKYWLKFHKEHYELMSKALPDDKAYEELAEELRKRSPEEPAEPERTSQPDAPADDDASGSSEEPGEEITEGACPADDGSSIELMIGDRCVRYSTGGFEPDEPAAEPKPQKIKPVAPTPDEIPDSIPLF